MENTIDFFGNAKWAALTGAFTVADLKDIIEMIENPEKRKATKED